MKKNSGKSKCAATAGRKADSPATHGSDDRREICCVCGKYAPHVSQGNQKPGKEGITVLLNCQIRRAHLACASKNKLPWFGM